MKNEISVCSYGFVTADPKSLLVRIRDESVRVKPSHAALMAYLIGHAGFGNPHTKLFQGNRIRPAQKI